VKVLLDLPMEPPRDWERFVEPELVGFEQQERAERKFRGCCFRPPKLRPELGRRQNMLAEEEEEWVDRMARQVIFCGAASARASICACKVFNTEERAGSIGQPGVNHS
jgi:hypothetical protein